MVGERCSLEQMGEWCVLHSSCHWALLQLALRPQEFSAALRTDWTRQLPGRTPYARSKTPLLSVLRTPCLLFLTPSVSNNRGCSTAILLKRSHISLCCRNMLSRQRKTRSHGVRVSKPARSGLEAGQGRTSQSPRSGAEGPQAPFHIPYGPTSPTDIACSGQIPLRPIDSTQEGSRGGLGAG